MIKNSVLNTYIIREFLLSTFNVTLIISAAGLIMNLREEVTYFTDYDVGIMLPIALSLMIIPSILINIFPFVIFLSAMWTLIKLKNMNNLVEKISESFLKLCLKKRGEIKASLISSKEVYQSDLDKINKELSQSIGATLKFDYVVDKNLIGGLKLQLGSFMIATSIKNKLKKYEQAMLEN